VTSRVAISRSPARCTPSLKAGFQEADRLSTPDKCAPTLCTVTTRATPLMQAMGKQPIKDSCVDCSDIADNLLEAAGGAGKVISFRGPGDTLVTPEGNTTVDYLFHHVYTDGRYAYDPRLSQNAIPWGDYMRTLKTLNPGLRYGPPGFAGPFS
jgi:hypothetical protein